MFMVSEPLQNYDFEAANAIGTHFFFSPFLMSYISLCRLRIKWWKDLEHFYTHRPLLYKTPVLYITSSNIFLWLNAATQMAQSE